MASQLARQISGSLFIVIVLLTSAQLVANVSVEDSFTSGSMFNGEKTQGFDSRVDDDIPIKQFGINFWAALEYVFFSQGKNGITVGDDGWLFTTEEILANADAERALQQNIEYIIAISDGLKRQDVQLILVPVPSKARVYSEHLGRHHSVAMHRKLLGRFNDAMSEAGVHHIDALTPLVHFKAQGEAFFRTDTHWTPEGAYQVAAGLATYITQTMKLEPISSFTTLKQDHSSIQGDLISFLPLSPWFESLLPAEELMNQYTTVGNTDESELFFEEKPPITAVLVGTSYSANPDWNFAGAIKNTVGRDLISYAASGHGPIKPMHDFISKHLGELPSVELVIWEIPERYLLVGSDEAKQSPFKTHPMLMTSSN